MTLFGPNPAEVSEARADQTQANGFNWANLPAGRGGVAAAAMAGTNLGRGIGEATGIYQDPAMQKARLMEEAKMEVDSSGVSLLTDPNAYYEAAYNALQKRGLQDEAMNVRNLMRAESMQDRTMAVSETEAGAKALSAQAAYANALNDTTDRSKNREFIEMPDGSILDLQKGSPEMKEAMAAGGKPYKQASALERLIYAQSQQSERQRQQADAAAERAAQAQAYRLAAQTASDRRAAADVILAPVYQKSNAAREMVDGANELLSLLDRGDTELGFAIDARTGIVKMLQFFDPSMADSVGEALNVNPANVEAQNRIAAIMDVNLAASLDANSGRISATLLNMIKDAGPSVYLTTEGQYVAASMIKARAQADQEVERRVSEWVRLRDDENLTSESYQRRLVNVPSKLHEIRKEVSMQDFLPSDVEEKAELAAEMAKIEFIPTDPAQLKKGKLYRTPVGVVVRGNGPGKDLTVVRRKGNK